MNTLSNLVSSVDKKANNYLSFLDNKYVRTSILTFLAIYIAIWSPRLPKSMNHLFKNNFSFFVFSLTHNLICEKYRSGTAIFFVFKNNFCNLNGSSLNSKELIPIT